jgi:hypothetical protein
MDMDPSPRASVFKRVFLCALILLVLGVIGAFAALTATNPKIPHPWGEIRFTQFSSNSTGTMAHFRFRNKFVWPVFVEIGLETRNSYNWEMARGYTFFVPIEKAVTAHGTQDFSVPVPFDTKEWRVLVRAAKAELSKTDVTRERVKDWLDSHGAGFLGKKLEVEGPNGHIMPGPEMRFDKPGRLPTPYY